MTRRLSCYPLSLCCLAGLYLFTFCLLGWLRGLNQSEPGTAPDDPGPARCVEGPARTSVPVHVSRCQWQTHKVVTGLHFVLRTRTTWGREALVASLLGGLHWQVMPFQRSRPWCCTQDVWQTSTTTGCKGFQRKPATKSVFYSLTFRKYLNNYTKRLNTDFKKYFIFKEGVDLRKRLSDCTGRLDD